MKIDFVLSIHILQPFLEEEEDQDSFLAYKSFHSSYLPTNFTLLLYQFIKADMLSETDK